MAPYTANAGKVYFPAGTPDPLDVRDGVLDMAAGVEREMIEEVGLAADGLCRRAALDLRLFRPAHRADPRTAFAAEADALHERIAATIAAQDDPELAAIHLVRGTADLTSAMPPFVAAYLRHAFAA